MKELDILRKTLYDMKATPSERLYALEGLYKLHLTGVIYKPEHNDFVNNHIHTTYSFSPYTPSAALYEAWRAGLSTAGIMDHDSVGGAEEFIEAGKILNMPVTVGCEVRVSTAGTKLYGRRINNPDQNSVAYVAIHGIPHQNLVKLEQVLSEKRKLRNKRNRSMCGVINNIASEYGIMVSFDDDVVPLSMADRGGSITERHVLYALVLKICEGRSREEAISLCEKLIGHSIPEAKRNSLADAPEKYFTYDLLGIMKSSLIEKVYINASDELMNIKDFIELCDSIGAISGYAYLGDVGESPTGDKKAQKFEDDYLNLLFDELTSLGFDAITYMPSRNTPEQLQRVMRLCDENGFFQISGEDINQPRQSFICKELEKPEFRHLKKSTYALIGHELCATEDIENAMFSPKNRRHSLDMRIEYYSAAGGYNKKRG